MSKKNPLEENPWLWFAGIAGIAGILLGGVILIIPAGTTYDGDPDVAGAALKTVWALGIAALGGTLVLAWLLLGGLGWYLSRMLLARSEVVGTPADFSSTNAGVSAVVSNDGRDRG